MHSWSEFERTAATAADDGVRKDLTTFVGLIARYQKTADSAIDMSSVDANTGIAAFS